MSIYRFIRQSPEERMAEDLLKARQKTQEIADTERAYIESLREVVEGYLPLMKKTESADECDDIDLVMPEDLKEKKGAMVFGNIRALYEHHLK